MSQVIEEANQVTSIPQKRRASRSSPTNIEEEEEEGDIQNSNVTNQNRVTRSQSVESNGYEDSFRRKKRKSTSATVSSNTNNNNNNEDNNNERETRTAASRNNNTKKAKRDIIIKERLDELEKLELAVKNGTHSEYHKLLKNIEQKKSTKIQEAEMRRSFAEKNVMNFFHAQKYAADSQYYWDKLALRRSMIQHVQHKINLLEQEYYSNHVSSSLDEEHLNDWVPPDRPSVISSLTLGLTEEEAANDIEWAKGNDPEQEHVHTNNQYPAKASSPPLDMLASLVDHRHQQDKDFPLPSLLRHR